MRLANISAIVTLISVVASGALPRPNTNKEPSIGDTKYSATLQARGRPKKSQLLKPPPGLETQTLEVKFVHSILDPAIRNMFEEFKTQFMTQWEVGPYGITWDYTPVKHAPIPKTESKPRVPAYKTNNMRFPKTKNGQDAIDWFSIKQTVLGAKIIDEKSELNESGNLSGTFEKGESSNTVQDKSDIEMDDAPVEKRHPAASTETGSKGKAPIGKGPPGEEALE